MYETGTEAMCVNVSRSGRQNERAVRWFRAKVCMAVS